MPVQPTYPGVYIEEIPSGVRTITGVATSTAAFIGYFRRGPMNQAVQIFNLGDFEREFGGLDSLSEAGYAIQQFFLNGGTQAYVIRVASGSPTTSSVVLEDSSGSDTLEIEAIQEGTWGDNVRVKIDHDTPQDSEFNMTITEYNPASGQALRQEIFRNLSMDENSPRRNFVTTVINDANTGSQIIRISDNTALGTAPPAINGTLSEEHLGGSGVPVGHVVVDPAHTLNVMIGGTDEDINLQLDDLAVGESYPLSTIALALEDAIRSSNLANPAFAKASVSVVGNRLHVLAGGSAPETIVEFANGAGNTIADELLLSASEGAQANAQEYSLGATIGTEGNDGTVPDATALIGSLNSKTGMFALEDVDLFNILCIPRTGMTSGTNPMDPAQADAVISAATAYSEQKRAFLIVDTPLGINELAEIKNWMAARGTLRHKNAALYYPRVNIPDPLDNFRLRSVGASGTIAGLYARTDSNRGVWKAPAGTEAALRNVPELTDILSDQENGVLNPLGVNCLRNFPVYGNICWGGRTLEGADQMASEWKYVPVRRLALFLEESLFRGTQWVVFEPNDEPLWAQIRLNVGAFMNNLFRQGAFQGTTPRDAYLVKCDRETTTQNDINLGIVNVVVGFAPLKPAEFVIIKIQQLAGQVQA